MRTKTLVKESVKKLNKLHAEMKAIEQEVSEAMRGKFVEVISDYNGQMCGSSKPSQSGKILEVATFFYSHGEPQLFLSKFRYGCPALGLDEVRFVNESK